jgi:hypothetical protein
LSGFTLVRPKLLFFRNPNIKRPEEQHKGKLPTSHTAL